ncbi:glycosyltransferase family 2 protein [Candidatus Thioglobus sp.]|nr:glycosyltransferase family 2 protein [Candidatus Thioglobus sp.]MDC1165333.1 glycosyltransferase family 2 protein [Candidatus Thioglobus sp.]
MELLEKDNYMFTIGYATYNRKDCIVRRLNSLIAMDIPDNVEIIIVDNASSDGTFEAISDLTAGTKIRAYCNNENLGFAGNFVETLRRAKGDYVMWSSDEDEINLGGIQNLFDWIGNKKFDVVFLNHYRKEKSKKLFPLRKNKTRIIECEDLWRCSHLPGSVWNRSVALANLNDWGKMKEIYPNISRYYPNLLLMIKLIPSFNSYFFNGYIAYQKDYEKSQHVAQSGYQYPHLIPRWLQHNELISFIELRIQKTEDIKNKKYLHKMHKSLNRNIYTYISTAIREENPSLYVYFSRSCSPIYIARRWYDLIKLVFKFLFDDPLLAIYKIKKRLKIRYTHNNKL